MPLRSSFRTARLRREKRVTAAWAGLVPLGNSFNKWRTKTSAPGQGLLSAARIRSSNSACSNGPESSQVANVSKRPARASVAAVPPRSSS